MQIADFCFIIFDAIKECTTSFKIMKREKKTTTKKVNSKTEKTENIKENANNKRKKQERHLISYLVYYPLNCDWH